jgi:hypothetical protein
MDPELIDNRHKMLSAYINDCLKRPVLIHSKELQNFVEMPEDVSSFPRCVVAQHEFFVTQCLAGSRDCHQARLKPHQALQSTPSTQLEAPDITAQQLAPRPRCATAPHPGQPPFHHWRRVSLKS